MHILCQGNRVKVTLNGTQIVDADLAAHPDKLPNHPGLKRTAGYVGLQNHSSRLDLPQPAHSRAVIACRKMIRSYGRRLNYTSGRAGVCQQFKSCHASCR